MRWLFVIARNSSFAYKGQAVDVQQVGRELGVRYVLTGSVRKAANRVRIGAQLIEAATRAHIWADQFEGTLDDIFDVQDQVTRRVIGAIVPKLEDAEIERAKRKVTENLNAYDYYLRALAALHRRTREANEEVVSLIHKAIALDPDFASAYGLGAFSYTQRKTYGWMTDRARGVAEAAGLARQAADLGKNDPVALGFAGSTLSYVVHDLETGAAMIDRALALHPNQTIALWSSWVKIWLGDPEAARDLCYAAEPAGPVYTSDATYGRTWSFLRIAS